MRILKVFAAVLLVLCLAGAPALADEDDFSEIAGVWYTEEIQMEITEEGRFLIEWNDEDWSGSLEPDWRMNEEGEEYLTYVLYLDDPELSIWEDLEFLPDIYHPGKLDFVRDGVPGDVFYDVPICVMDMAGEDLDTYEPYYYIDSAQGEEPAITMMFTLLRPATDIAVMVMFDQEITEDGDLGYNADSLEWWPELDSQERIVVTHVFEGDLPNLGIGFVDEQGERHDFAVDISGEDGELILWELAPSNG